MQPILKLISCSALACSLQVLAHEATPPSDQSCTRYIGNEGIMVTSGETKVLFDAFYANSYGQYALVPDNIQQALIAGTPPYDHVDALFVSHAHGDHFSPQPTLDFLNANSDVELYASKQVIDSLKALGIDDQLSARLKAFELDAGDAPQTMSIDSITIDVVRIPHTGGTRTASIENLAFRVSLGETLSVLHLGDADPRDRLFAPLQAHWDAKPLDIAFPPYWFLDTENGRSILDNRLKPQRTIGLHVPIAAADDPEAWRVKYNGDLFTTPGEVRVLGKDGCFEHIDHE